jgi:hypothetical protein
MYRAGFDRNFLEQRFIQTTKQITLPYNSYYISGTSSTNVYLGNWTNPFHMIVVDLESLDSQHVKIHTENHSIYKDPEQFRLKVDSPYFYLTHGTIPAMLRGQLDALTASNFMNESVYFDDAVPVSKSSFALRSYNAAEKSFELAKKTNEKAGFKYHTDILQKQLDGVFCVDGMLHFNKATNEIIYLYRYRNQYMVMDSSLNLKYRSTTLDTFSHAPIKVKNIDAKNSKMLTGIPNIINVMSAASDQYLYIKSNILAKNEDIKSFTEGSTFDIYNTDTGKYVTSVNIYNPYKSKLSDFAVTKNKLIALYVDQLVIYNIDVALFH